MKPKEWLERYGMVGYTEKYICLKKHKYIDSCIKHEFRCTTTLKDYDEKVKNALRLEKKRLFD